MQITRNFQKLKMKEKSCMPKHRNNRNCDIWIIKAKSDLKAAKLLRYDEETWDATVFHTQQCAEKALKAFLDFSKKPITKTHDLELLVALCSKIDSHFEGLKMKAATIKPYATKFRYPDDLLHPDACDVDEAINCAEYIFNFVKQKLKT